MLKTYVFKILYVRGRSLFVEGGGPRIVGGGVTNWHYLLMGGVTNWHPLRMGGVMKSLEDERP